MKVTEHRSTAKGFPDLILYDAMVSDGVLLLRDGSLLAAWSYVGPDMQTRSHEEMAALSQRLSRILLLGAGWMIHCSAIRSSSEGYAAAGVFPDPVTAMIDAERRQQFLLEGAHYESEYFLVLTYQPPFDSETKMRALMFSTGADPVSPGEVALRHFKERIATVEDNLKSLFALRRLWLNAATGDDELLRFLHRCISGNNHPVRRPEVPACLQDVIGCIDFVGGIEPMCGDRHLRIVAIDGFPLKSVPGILRVLDTLAVDYRWSTRAVLLDGEEARVRIEKTRRKWRSKFFGFIDNFREVPKGAPNEDAIRMAADAVEALAEASEGLVQFAYYDSQVVFLDRDRKRIAESVASAMKAIRNIGFCCRLETVNSVDAFLGSLPGDGYRNMRRSVLHTLNLADMLPITSVWAGALVNPSPLMPANSPPLLYAATTGSTPFRFHLHVDDLGHVLMAGPPGSGKSTALALIVAQWFRFPEARVFAFDKGYSSYALTKACGGDFYDPAGEADGGLRFCPLEELDTAADLSWAAEWLETLCVLQNQAVGPRERGLLLDALRLLQDSPKRTLTELCANLQDEDLRAALAPYLLGHALGDLLDGDHETLSDGRFITYELGSLMAMGEKATGAVLPYLFRRIFRQIERGHGEPTLVVLDEAWVMLRHERFREQVRDWLKTLRKSNACVVLATQNLSDIFNSPIKDVILESCPTKILLPNAEALNAASRTYYEQLGLGAREIEAVRDALPKRDYYCVSAAGRRMIELGMGPVALSFCGVSSREERAALDQAIERYDGAWPAAWLRGRGQGDWAGYLESVRGADPTRRIA